MRRLSRASWDGVKAAATPINIIGLMAALALAVVLVIVFLQGRTADQLSHHVALNDQRAARVELIAAQNRETTCSIARLVAYVPAMQFEGEPLDNFVNWIVARQALLTEAAADYGCDPTVEAILRERVAKDQKLLDELGRAPRP